MEEKAYQKETAEAVKTVKVTEDECKEELSEESLSDVTGGLLPRPISFNPKML